MTHQPGVVKVGLSLKLIFQVVIFGTVIAIIFFARAKVYVQIQVILSSQAVEKGCGLQKSWVKKSCKINSGSHEMAAMMWMIINFNNGFVH